MEVIIAKKEKERNDAFAIRKIVFVEEQNVPLELEMDEFDEEATHFVLYDHHEPIGAARFRTLDANGTQGKIERVCILAPFRNRGLGKMLIEKIIEHARQEGVQKVKLNAQTHAISFYEKLGFTVISDEFIDAGIPHRTMEKTL